MKKKIPNSIANFNIVVFPRLPQRLVISIGEGSVEDSALQLKICFQQCVEPPVVSAKSSQTWIYQTNLLVFSLGTSASLPKILEVRRGI
jgi:hypothetical protein